MTYEEKFVLHKIEVDWLEYVIDSIMKNKEESPRPKWEMMGHYCKEIAEKGKKITCSMAPDQYAGDALQRLREKWWFK